MVLSEDEAKDALRKGTHVLIVTDGHVEMAAPYSQSLLDVIMISAKTEGKRCMSFTTKPPFSFVDPTQETLAVLVKLDDFNYDKLFEIPSTAPAEEIKVGSRVLCQTSVGRKKGTVSSAQMRITPSMQTVLSILTGATFPLKPVIASIHTNYFPPYHD